jgi:ferredoxin
MPKVKNLATNQEFELNTDEILYDGLEERGEILPHGCLSGSCGACRVEIHQGAENLDPIGFIEQNTVDSIKQYIVERKLDDEIEAKTIRLSCRAKVLGDVIFSPYTKDK